MRYQNFTDRLTRLREAASRGGWVLTNLSEVESRPFWIATHPLASEQSSRIAWSMMHGNEPTGFEALILLIERGIPSSNWTLIPLVNPTGIDAFTRLNREGVDLNRRARESGPAESDYLKNILRTRPYELALNLHDQRSIFHPAGERIPSSLSVLAPAALLDGQPIQPVTAVAWAGSIYRWMNERQPNWGYARFDESYYPTAFGEWVQELGIPTVTIETGIAIDDPSRIRVAHELYHALCTIDQVAKPLNDGHAAYYSLPYNQATGCDFEIVAENEVSYWKFWEEVQNGRYTAGIERVDEVRDVVPYRQIALANTEYNRLVQRSIWKSDDLYASASTSLRDLAEVLPK